MTELLTIVVLHHAEANRNGLCDDQQYDDMDAPEDTYTWYVEVGDDKDPYNPIESDIGWSQATNGRSENTSLRPHPVPYQLFLAWGTSYSQYEAYSEAANALQIVAMGYRMVMLKGERYWVLGDLHTGRLGQGRNPQWCKTGNCSQCKEARVTYLTNAGLPKKASWMHRYTVQMTDLMGYYEGHQTRDAQARAQAIHNQAEWCEERIFMGERCDHIDHHDYRAWNDCPN